MKQLKSEEAYLVNEIDLLTSRRALLPNERRRLAGLKDTLKIVRGRIEKELAKKQAELF